MRNSTRRRSTPASPSAQLVLGIKGTLSVVELKVIRQRLLAGQESKARRGELFKRLRLGMPQTPWVRLRFIPIAFCARCPADARPLSRPAVEVADILRHLGLERFQAQFHRRQIVA